MYISKKQRTEKHIYINNNLKDRVHNQVGTTINGNKRSTYCFINMKHILSSHDISLNIKMRLVRCYLFSILFYGAETSTLYKGLTNTMEAFEMWVYRRILKVPWMQKVTNEEVLRRMNMKREISMSINQRKHKHLGHIIRVQKYQFQIIIQDPEKEKYWALTFLERMFSVHSRQELHF